nr:glycosyltransferase family A protein [Zavarzinella formosa]
MGVGIVAIGRNEGERLRTCLRSLSPDRNPVVYVDSGSTDGSPDHARSAGVRVIDLDLSIPFTAARARNAGWRQLLAEQPDTEFIQFVDGDCEVRPDWLETAATFLREHPEVVVVCGRRRERHPEATVYNRLCDLEWDTPIGKALACGGDAMFRVSKIVEAGGYREDLIAGEEPELCLRLRELGGRIFRLDAEMTLHDAAMTRFGQWWKRNVRAGHAFAEVSTIHRHSPCRIWKRETRSNFFWGLAVPMAAVVPAWWTFGISLALLLGYPVLFAKIFRSRRRGGDETGQALRYSWYCVLSKFPQVRGQLTYFKNRLFRRRTRLIEYKAAGPAA